MKSGADIHVFNRMNYNHCSLNFSLITTINFKFTDFTNTDLLQWTSYQPHVTSGGMFFPALVRHKICSRKSS